MWFNANEKLGRKIFFSAVMSCKRHSMEGVKVGRRKE